MIKQSENGEIMENSNFKSHILLIASTPLSHDGLTKIEMDIIERFHNEIDFSVACAWGFDNNYGDRLKKITIALYKLPSKRSVIKYSREIARIVKKEKFDAVYIHGNSAMMILESFPAKLGGAKRIITHCHNTKSNFPLIHHLVKPFLNIIVDEKIGCSTYAAKWAYSGNDINVINNGIDVNRFRFDEHIRQQIRLKLDWNDNYIIGHVGRLTSQKNHDMLIEIFKEYHAVYNNARLLLIGTGELKEHIVEKIKKDNLDEVVLMMDYSKNIQDYYHAMDIMVMPSLHEGLCLVALEAQANGLPLLISDKCAPETAIVPETVFVSLEAGVEMWVHEIENLRKFKHKDNFYKVKNTWADEENMMSAIKKILSS